MTGQIAWSTPSAVNLEPIICCKSHILLASWVIQDSHNVLLRLLQLPWRLFMRIDPATSLGLLLRHYSLWGEAGRPLDRGEGHSLLLVVLAIHNRLAHLAASIATAKMIALVFLALFVHFYHCWCPVTNLPVVVLRLEDELACLALFIFIILPVRIIKDAGHFTLVFVSCHYAVPTGGDFLGNSVVVWRGLNVFRPDFDGL